MAARFWRAMLACQLALGALVAAILGESVPLSPAVEVAITLGVAWLTPGILVILALALSHRSVQAERFRWSEYGHLLRAVLSETLSFNQAVLAMSFASRSWEVRGPPAGSRPQPVLLVHGIACNRGVWNPLVRLLRKAGIGPVHAINLEPLWVDIDGHAALVVRELRAIQAQANGARVAIIAHSMGGLVARAALRSAGPKVIVRIVTIGAPHHGTVIARYARSRLAKQMRPESEWLAALNAAQESRLEVPTSSIYSLHDWLIRPPWSAVLKGAERHELQGIGHLGMVRDHRSLNRILEVLREDESLADPPSLANSKAGGSK
jgi:pimeloyl-ACP methyl ester carboxylesterase